MQVPSGASRIDGTEQPSAEFDLENSPNWAPGHVRQLHFEGNI